MQLFVVVFSNYLVLIGPKNLLYSHNSENSKRNDFA